MPVAMSDIFQDAEPDSLLLDRRVWVTVGFLLAAPLAFSRTLGALRYRLDRLAKAYRFPMCVSFLSVLAVMISDIFY